MPVPRPRSAMRKIREVLRLSLGDGLSRRQVGAATGLPYTTVAAGARRPVWARPSGDAMDREGPQSACRSPTCVVGYPSADVKRHQNGFPFDPATPPNGGASAHLSRVCSGRSTRSSRGAWRSDRFLVVPSPTRPGTQCR